LAPENQVTKVLFAHETWQLLPEKAVYWPRQKTLIISDVHLGKAKHFQSQGISIPGDLGRKDIARIAVLLQQYQPQTCLFLGDLFHAKENSDWELLVALIQDYPAVRFVLVKGNHDFLADKSYERAGLHVCDRFEVATVVFLHEPQENKRDLFTIVGHVHPGVLLKGPARARFRLPCFYVEPQQMILPAFGNFTGLYTMQPRGHDRVFGVGGGVVFEVTPTK
jgi:DNA ligase-associated metallophosphoesterase